MKEITFLVEESQEGGFTARALGESIFTEAEDLPELRENIKEAVHCHFEEKDTPRVVRLHFVREEFIAV